MRRGGRRVGAVLLRFPGQVLVVSDSAGRRRGRRSRRRGGRRALLCAFAIAGRGVANEVFSSFVDKLQQGRGDEKGVDRAVKPSVAPAFEAVEEEQQFRHFQIGILGQDHARQFLLPVYRHFVLDAGEEVHVFKLYAEPDDGQRFAIAATDGSQLRRRPPVCPIDMAGGKELYGGIEGGQKLFGRPV